MTIRLSTGARNGLAQGMGFGGMFNRGVIQIWSGSQPASADAAATGTLLATVSTSSGAVTNEVRATGTITLNTGASGSINTVTVGTFNIIPDGAVNFNTSLTQTAADLAESINRNGIFQATSAGAVVTITPRPGAGTTYNTLAVTATLTTITAAYANMSGGVAAVNGLIFGEPVAGLIGKGTGQVWSFNGAVAGTAGWYRLVQSASDGGGLLSAAPWLPRMDGSVGTSGADLNLSNIVIAVGAPTTIDTWSFQVPAS